MFTKTIGKVCQTQGCSEKGKLKEPLAALCESCGTELAAEKRIDKRRAIIAAVLIFGLVCMGGFIAYQRIRAAAAAVIGRGVSQANTAISKGIGNQTTPQNGSGQAPPSNPGGQSTKPSSPVCDDEHLAAYLMDRFSNDEDLKAYNIQVYVTRATVELKGSVSSDLERTDAVEIVRNAGCPVASIVDDLKIETSDSVLADRIKKAFESNRDLRTQPIKVEVSRGNVFLSGSVSQPIMRTAAAEIAGSGDGVKTVTNNIQVVPVSNSDKHSSGDSEGNQTQPHPAALSGSWIGTYLNCAQAQIPVQFNITESAPDDITADIEIQVPNARAGTFTAHGVLNTVNNFLSFQFSGWEYQPPGISMGNIGGYVTFTDRGPTNYEGIIRSPGCGRISLTKH